MHKHRAGRLGVTRALWPLIKKRVVDIGRRAHAAAVAVWRWPRMAVRHGGQACLRVWRLLCSLAAFLKRLATVIVEIMLLAPNLYGEYKRLKHKGWKNKLQAIRRIAHLVYLHKIKPLLPPARPTGNTPALRVRRYVLRSGAVLTIVAVMVINLILPMLSARAASLTWSTNADFAMNKAGKCGTTSLANLAVSVPAQYIDQSCATGGIDSSLSLQRNPGSRGKLGGVRALAAGSAHSLALKDDGTVWAWGLNANGQLGDNTVAPKEVPVQVVDATGAAYLNNIIAIAAGGNYSLALGSDGSVWSWGENTYGQLGDGSVVQRNLPVKVKDTSGAGYLTGITGIAAGYYHGLAVKLDGSVWAWGQNTNGQLGDSTSAQRNLPVQVKDSAGTGLLGGVNAIATGYGHSLALGSDGKLWAWGANANGQLGDSSTTQRYLPVRVKNTLGTDDLTGVAKIEAGYYYSIVVLNDQTLCAWGQNTNGQLGDNTTVQKNIPVQVLDSLGTGALTNVSLVDGGASHSIAQKSDGTVWAWGLNTNGQLGDNTTTQRILPIQVKDTSGASVISAIKAVAANNNHSLAVSTAGNAWAWGLNTSGQLGDNTQSQRNLAVQVSDSAGGSTLSGIADISANSDQSLALKTDGTVWAWGTNGSGQLGDNTTSQRTRPIQVKDAAGTGYLTGVMAVAAGGSHSLALKGDGTVWAWGKNDNGQLGDNTTSQRSRPVQVRDAAGTGYLTGVISITAGGSHSIALKNDGTVWAWGLNTEGTLGDNTTTQRTLPVQVKNATDTGYLDNITKISSLQRSTIALKNDGTLWAWGYNGFGQLGDGTTTQRNLPVQVKDSPGTGYLTGITDISAGGTHSVALKNDDTAWAWGWNSHGQLGDNTNGQRNLPVRVRDSTGTGYLGNIKSIKAASGYNDQWNSGHTVVLQNDGTVLVWGNNGYGQLANGTYTAVNWAFTLPARPKDAAGTGQLAQNAATIAVGGTSTFVIKNDGTALAWGYNNYGNLGDGAAVVRRTLPVTVRGASAGNMTGITAVSAGRRFSLALKNDGTVWAWGSNGFGQLGDGTTSQRNTPVQVKDPTGASYLTDVKAISAANDYALALKNDGTVWAWGGNGTGQLGDNTTVAHTLPVQVKDATGTGYLTGITAISAVGSAYGGGYYAHSLALKNDGTVWAWGRNAYGELGDNTTTQRNLPIQVKDATGSGFLTGIVGITSGALATSGSSFALKNDGTVWAWGGDVTGDGTTNTRKLPVQVKDTSGTGYLGDITAIDAGENYCLALKNDGTVWAWGINGNGQLGDGSTTRRLLPVQVKDTSGAGFITGITSISAGGSDASDNSAPQNTHSLAIKNDGSLWAWGNNASGELGDNTTTNRQLPVQVKDYNGTGNMSNVATVTSGTTHSMLIDSTGTVWAWGSNGYGQLSDYFTGRLSPMPVVTPTILETTYYPNGSLAGVVVDLGPGRRTKWYSVAWNSSALPVNTSISFMARTSSDGTTWTPWGSGATQGTVGSVAGTADLSALPYSRYIELKATLTTTDLLNTPVLNDFSLSMMDDQAPPPQNASNIAMKQSATGADVTQGAWNNAVTPYFAWDNGADNQDGSGIAGYCLYLGQDNTADMTQTKGVLGTSPLNTDGKCQFAVAANDLDLSTPGVLSGPIASSNSSYYLLVKALDNAGNLYSGAAAQFAFKHDVTNPNNLSFVSLPSQFIATKDVTITWPTSGASSASDGTSGLAGIQYRIGNTGTWYGLAHNGKQDASDVIPLGDGSYQTDPTYDYPLLDDGNNMIYFRALDVAGNVSSTLVSAVIKINSSSPSSPQVVTATPATNTTNSFAFSWSAPATYIGQPGNITYCYTVNTLPTDNTCTYTAPGQTSLSPGAYATQPGDNTFYVAAKDEAGNINYATAGSVTFKADTSAPGIPLNLDIADISVKAAEDWKLALSWAAPNNAGAGVAQYRIYRSTSPTDGFTQVATTSGLGYFDGKLSQQDYYYKVRACDSANNCGAETSVVNKQPTGRYTSPAKPIGSPTVQVSTRKATIRWTTERESDSRVQYGTESGKYQPTESSTSAQAKVHSVELTGLEAGTTYYYKAKWTDEDGNTGKSSELMFTTLPAPVIKDVSVIKKSLTSATIQFTATDATSVRLNFGKTENMGGLKVVNTSTSQSTYTVELDGLDDGATYYYRPDTTDSDSYVYGGEMHNFVTPARPHITDLRFQPIVGEPTSTQKVTWQTNVPTTTQVTYGIGGNSGRDVLDSKLVTDHTMIVRELKDDSSYFLFAQSRDADGNVATSDRQIFRTALDTRPPSISDVNIEASVKGTGADARGQIVVTWKTDEPTTSQVAYGQGGGGTYSSSTVDDARLMTEHTVVISDLKTSSVYYLQPLSRDNAGNITKADEQSAIIGRPTDNVVTIILNALYKTFGL